MKTKTISLTIAAVAALAAMVHLALAGQSKSIFPLDEGATWTYAGHAKWTVTNSNNQGEGDFRWKAEVVKTFSSPGIKVGIVKGFPFDLAWYDPEKKPAYAAVIEDSKGLFEADVETQADAEALAAKALRGQVVGDQLLRFPIKVGDCLGDGSAAPELIADKMYCWFVRKRVEGRNGKGWEIIQETAPDDLSFYLVPGVGITRLVYNHHGTVAKTDARLIEFHHSPKD